MATKVPATRSARAQPQPAWSYDVQAQGAVLHVEARFAATTARSLTTDDDAAPFVRDVEFLTGAGWVPAAREDRSDTRDRAQDAGSAWSAACLASGCRVRYAFDLGSAAATIDGVDTALAAGGLVVSPPSTWLLRPSDTEEATEGLVRFRVTGAGFACAMGASATAPGSFETSTTDIDAASFAVFGPFHEAVVRSGSAQVHVVIAPQGLAMSTAEVQEWVERAVTGVAAYYGAFPTPHTLVVVVPGKGQDTEGETLGDGGPSVIVRPAKGLTASMASDDWVVVHELLHVTLPSLGRDDSWLAEGIATYVEPIVRARQGIVSVERFWSDLITGLPQGLPETGDEGLERTHTWGRTYWGGALFCLLADVRIRERTKGGRSFDDALRGIVATGANVSSHWSIEAFLDDGDRATGTTVLRDLYREMGLAPGSVDLGALWKRLGVRARAGKSVAFDDHAELAGVRLAITAPETQRLTRPL
jgi:hypothetical protein